MTSMSTDRPTVPSSQSVDLTSNAIAMTALGPVTVAAAIERALAEEDLTWQASFHEPSYVRESGRPVVTDLVVWSDDPGRPASTVMAAVRDIVDDVRRTFPACVISHDLAR